MFYFLNKDKMKRKWAASVIMHPTVQCH